jgi:hypothetical protein
MAARHELRSVDLDVPCAIAAALFKIDAPRTHRYDLLNIATIGETIFCQYAPILLPAPPHDHLRE